MAIRPNVFDKRVFQDALRQQGCPENFIEPATSDYRLFVPMVFAELGEEGVLRIVQKQSSALGLGDATSAWQTVLKYLIS